MATYGMLAHFTERGIMNVKKTAQRQKSSSLWLLGMARP